MLRKAALFLALTAAPAAAQQLSPPSTGGIVALDRMLGHLATNKRLLVIAAHPDDESSELIALASRGLGIDAAYFSLSRGEGGQNLIGTELGEGLGLIRSGELVSARAIDGARQFFSRAFDFGFSKSIAEADRFWPRDTSLADLVRVIRRFRPQILVAVFSGTARDGHGQHQQSGLVAQQAFALLRDSAWGPKKLYRSAFFDTSQTTVRLNAGVIDPAEGRSYTQVAVQSRSQHRSQDMGGIQRLGASIVRMSLLASVPTADSHQPTATNGTDDGLFAGIDTSLAPSLRRFGQLIDSARAVLGPRSLPRVRDYLLAAMTELRRSGDRELMAARESLLTDAILTASGVIVDATIDDARLVPGQRAGVLVATWSGAGTPARMADAMIETRAGWAVAPAAPPQQGIPAGVQARGFSVTVPDDAPLTEPYFLARPRAGALYDWTTAPEALRGEPFDPPVLSARVNLEIGGVPLVVRREVSYRFADQAVGEIRRPVSVVPAIALSVSPSLVVWPVQGTATRSLTVELTHNARGTTTADLRLEVPPGWPAVPSQQVSLEGEGTRKSYTFQVRAPGRFTPGAFEFTAVAVAGDRRFDRGVLTVDYPHIRPVQYTEPSTIRVMVASLALPRLRAVGYVRGASDVVPEALLAIGVPLTVLGAAELERADLAQFDVIVVGSRAYEIDPVLVANNGRLLDYARNGGRVIVQYQQYQFVTGNYAPFPLTMGRPHDRVTDETSPVRVLQPGHPLFQAPNRIGDEDWNGWVQERGLYFARTWDRAYTPLLEMGDGSERLQGGMLAARLGRGLYVYTGLAFFRELPAGVPGAYRLFANLLGMEPANVP